MEPSHIDAHFELKRVFVDARGESEGGIRRAMLGDIGTGKDSGDFVQNLVQM
jgi:hypothetical protein